MCEWVASESENCSCRKTRLVILKVCVCVTSFMFIAKKSLLSNLANSYIWMSSFQTLVAKFYNFISLAFGWSKVNPAIYRTDFNCKWLFFICESWKFGWKCFMPKISMIFMMWESERMDGWTRWSQFLVTFMWRTWHSDYIPFGVVLKAL